MKHCVYHIMLIYLRRGPSLISVLTSDNPITPCMPVHTMNTFHLKTSLGFSIPPPMHSAQEPPCFERYLHIFIYMYI